MFGLLEQELPQHLAQPVGSCKPLVVSQPMFTGTRSIINSSEQFRVSSVGSQNT